jgi:hypothetical protein
MTFLLLRSSDQLLLGVSWDGMEMVPGGETPAHIRATTDAAYLVVTFPPQHVSEESFDLNSPAAPLPASAALAGPSRLVVSLAQGTTIALTIEGILRALAERPIIATAGGSPGTALELPSRLTVAPTSPAPGTAVVCRHSATPLGVSGTTALWRTRLGRSDLPTDGHIGVVASSYNPDDPAYRLPLPSLQRSLIVGATQQTPAAASRLELSALGGTLDVVGTWETFEWEQHCVLGRDMKVRTLARGAVYPFGHKAQLLQLTTRTVDPDAANTAVLRTLQVLTITEPVRDAAADAAARRGFPFTRVEIITDVVSDFALPIPQPYPFGGKNLGAYFWPERINPATGKRDKVQFAVVCENPDGAVHFAVPLIFVVDLTSEGVDSLNDPDLTQHLAGVYGDNAVALPGSTINLLGAVADHADPVAEQVVDSYELHGMSVGGLSVIPDPGGGGYRAAVTTMMVSTPALRSLLDTDAPRPMRFANDYLSGAQTEVLLHIDPASTIDVNFTTVTDRSGALIAPRYVADAVSRTTGLVNLQARPPVPGDPINPKALFKPDATILGFSMSDLLTDLHAPPTITSTLITGTAPDVTMQWTGIKLASHEGFIANSGATLDLTVKSGPTAAKTTCTVNKFGLKFPPDNAVLGLTIATINYEQNNGQPPTLTTSGVQAQFLGDLKLLEKLQDAVDLGRAGQLIEVSRSQVAVHYTFAAPPISTGAFVMRNIAFTGTITVPFDGQPVTVTLSFASRANPFQLSVLMFGGSGYAELELDKSGLQRFDGALEFGALVAVDFVVARGEVHALGGVRFTLQPDRSVIITGYLRIGGCVEILGLVSVSIELIIALAYQSARNALVGRATLVITIDLTLWSDTMEIDSGEWVLAGEQSHRLQRLAAADSVAFDGLAQWRLYQRAFFDPQPISDQLRDGTAARR